MRIWNLRCTEVYMVRHEFNLWGLQAHLTPTVHCSLQRCLVLGSACTILALQTSLLIAIGWHDQLLNTSFAGPNIYLVRIKLKLHSEDWELRLRWVSSVLGWTGVAGHFAQWLNRICLLRFSLPSSTSFDRVQTCRSYFTMSRHRCRHTNITISSYVRLLISQVHPFLGELYSAFFLQRTVVKELTIGGIFAAAHISWSSINSFISRGCTGFAACTNLWSVFIGDNLRAQGPRIQSRRKSWWEWSQ